MKNQTHVHRFAHFMYNVLQAEKFSVIPTYYDLHIEQYIQGFELILIWVVGTRRSTFYDQTFVADSTPPQSNDLCFHWNPSAFFILK